MIVERERIVDALRDACASSKVVGTQESEKRLELRLKAEDKWEAIRLVLPVGASQPKIESAIVLDSDDVSEDIPCVRTDIETLKGIACGKISAISAVSRGSLRMTGPKSAAVWAVPILKEAGMALLSASQWEVEERLDEIDVHVTGLTSGDESGVIFYEITAKAKICMKQGEMRLVPEWKVSRRYSEFRALWQQLKSSVYKSTKKEDEMMCSLGFRSSQHPPFPARNAISLETRRQGLETWLRHIVQQVSSPQELGKVYSFIGVNRELIDSLTQVRRARRVIQAGNINYDFSGGKRRADLVAHARKLQKKAEKNELHRQAYQLWLWTHLPIWFFFGWLLTLWPNLIGFSLCLMAEPLGMTYPVFGIATFIIYYTQNIVDVSIFLRCNILWRICLICIRQALLKKIGIIRALHVYLTASAIISVYVFTKFIANKRKLQGNDRDALFERVHSIAAPFIADRFVALKSIWCKIGQYISARADVVPGTWQKALARLQDDLPSDNLKCVNSTLKKAKLQDRVQVCGNAIASASIAQVHIGKLYSDKIKERKVAVKVQHHGIATLMTADIRRALRIAQFCARLDASFEPTVTILESWKREIHKELSFLTEVDNAQRARSALAHFATHVLVPEPLVAADTAFAMQFIENASKIDDIDFLDAYDVDRKALCTKFAHLISYLVFDVGFYNCDPHQGNVLWTPTNDGSRQLLKLVFLDWGWSHSLSPSEKNAWRDLVIAIDSMDTVKAIDALKKLGYANNQDQRAPERSVEFFQFLFRNTSSSEQAKEETTEFFEKRKVQKDQDASNSVREKGGRKMTKVPESFLFVVRVVGALRGICATLGVSISLPSIFALHASAGKAKDFLFTVTHPIDPSFSSPSESLFESSSLHNKKL